MARSFSLDPEVQQYVLDHTTAPTATEAACIEATAALGRASGMRIGREQGGMLRILVHMLQPELVVEVGTFTGYSALMMAQSLPPGGRLICCDVSEKWTTIAREAWQRGGVADRIDLRIGPALDTLRALPAETRVDFAFIDADKTGYRAYVETLVPLLSDRGAIAIDNTLWGGQVLDEGDTSADTVALRELNDWLVTVPGLDVAMLPLGDGVTLVRKA